MRRCLWFALLAGLAGCGDADTEEVELQPQEFVTVRSKPGEEQTIPAADLGNPPEKESAARQVLAVDRRTGQKTWVAVQKVVGQPPVETRYIPVTETQEPPATGD